MKIDVSKLSDGRRLEFHEVWDPVALELDSVGVLFDGSLKLDVEVSREAELVTVGASVKGGCRLTCHRCFKEFSHPMEKMLELTYPLEAGERFIDLDSDIRDEIILLFPQKILCKPDCRGLCVKCGADLNIEKCKCSG